jgi:hypothetical protein
MSTAEEFDVIVIGAGTSIEIAPIIVKNAKTSRNIWNLRREILSRHSSKMSLNDSGQRYLCRRNLEFQYVFAKSLLHSKPMGAL